MFNKMRTYTDTKHHQLVTDTPLAKITYVILMAFQNIFGFKLLLTNIQITLALMTEWRTTNTYPVSFVTEYVSALKCEQDDISHDKYAGQTLLDDNMREHFEDGFFVTQMAPHHAASVIMAETLRSFIAFMLQIFSGKKGKSTGIECSGQNEVIISGEAVS